METFKLQIFAKDPSLPSRAGALAEVDVDLTGLQDLGDTDSGPVNQHLRVKVRAEAPKPRQFPWLTVDDGNQGKLNPPPTDREAYFDARNFDNVTPERRLDLRSWAVLAEGVAPETACPRFAQAMVFAVAQRIIDVFGKSLGRPLVMGRRVKASDLVAEPLTLYVDAMRQANAYYDPRLHAVCFGYYDAAPGSPGRVESGSIMRTALSHDIVVHELTHALVDLIHPLWLLPLHADSLGFHEGFADLMAIFEQFQHRELVAEQIYQGGGKLDSNLLTEVAREFGRTIFGADRPLRRAVPDANDDPFAEFAPPALRYMPLREPHEHGETLLNAVYGAFRRIFDDKTERLRGLIGANGRITSREAAGLVAAQAQRLAAQFQALLIRALDYLPPLAVSFGDYLRALITADRDLVREDPWGYRESLVASFRRFDIPVQREDVPDLSVGSLLFKAPQSFHEERASLDASTTGGAALNLLRPSLRRIPLDAEVLDDVRFQRVGPDGQLIARRLLRWVSYGPSANRWLRAGTVVVDAGSASGQVLYHITGGTTPMPEGGDVDLYGVSRPLAGAIDSLRRNDWQPMIDLKRELGARMHGIELRDNR